MNFIIPKNYKFKNKILGIIDYSTAVINISWDLILYFLLKHIVISFTMKIFIFSALSFPILLITIIGFNNESPIYTFKYIITFLFKQKVYLFKKNCELSYEVHQQRGYGLIKKII